MQSNQLTHLQFLWFSYDKVEKKQQSLGEYKYQLLKQQTEDRGKSFVISVVDAYKPPQMSEEVQDGVIKSVAEVSKDKELLAYF